MHNYSVNNSRAIPIILVAASLFAVLCPAASRAFSQDRATSRVALVEDQEHATFRFMIDGNEVARLDDDGLHVVRNIEYGGSLADTGSGDAGHSKENAP